MNPGFAVYRRARLNVGLISAFASSVLAFVSASTAGTAELGLTVRNGVLMKGGSPYRGIGANYDTLFGRILRDENDTSSLDNLARLGQSGMPFVRFRANGFMPADQQLYLQHPAEFFRRLDKVVRCAEQNNIGLIPSLFWRLASIGGLQNELPSEIANPNSRSASYIRSFTRDVVSRYKGSPAIWGWEFGNEANLAVDLPAHGAGPRGPALLSSNSVRLKSSQLSSAYRVFAQTVREIDPSRIIEAGTTMPRPAAWHNARGQFWRPDNSSQYWEALTDLTPEPMNVISTHVYARAPSRSPIGAGNINQVIAFLTSASAKAGKPLFIGEFPVRDHAQADEFLRAIVTNRVPLSAFWVFDNRAQPEMTVTFDNSRSFVLDLVAQANAALAKP